MYRPWGGVVKPLADGCHSAPGSAPGSTLPSPGERRVEGARTAMCLSLYGSGLTRKHSAKHPLGPRPHPSRPWPPPC